MRKEHRENVSLFTMQCRLGADLPSAGITNPRNAYQFLHGGKNLFVSPQGEPLLLETRLRAFREFVKCLEDGRASRHEVCGQVRDFLDQQGDYASQIAFLQAHQNALSKKLEKILAEFGKIPQSVAREEIRILRDEISVLDLDQAHIRLRGLTGGSSTPIA